MWLRTLAATLAISGSIGLCFESIALAQGYVPPDMGIPGRRRGAGTRGDHCFAQTPTLTALLPDTGYGQTLNSTPSWFWYMPETTAAAEFVLFDRDGNLVYTTTIAIPQAGIVSLSLPDDIPLALDSDYHWYFSLICNPDDRSEDIYTEGWVRHVSRNAALMEQFEAATPIDRIALYAANGLWYDAIATLANLRRESPDNVTATDQWAALLEAVGLSEFAGMPLPPADLPSEPTMP